MLIVIAASCFNFGSNIAIYKPLLILNSGLLGCTTMTIKMSRTLLGSFHKNSVCVVVLIFKVLEQYLIHLVLDLCDS